jgi:hypothetical protein
MSRLGKYKGEQFLGKRRKRKKRKPYLVCATPFTANEIDSDPGGEHETQRIKDIKI